MKIQFLLIVSLTGIALGTYLLRQSSYHFDIVET